MRYLLHILFVLLLSAASVAKAITVNYDCAETNGSFTVDCAIGEAQFLTTVEDVAGKASFKFENIGSDQSTIANIFFDDTTSNILNFATVLINNAAAGVSFSPGSAPGDLPGSVPFDVSFATDADSPKPSNGINSEFVSTGMEVLEIIVDYSGISDFDMLLAALNAGNFQMGFHAISFADGGSEWFTSNPPTPSPIPVPAAFWLFGTALIGFIGISRRTKV